jgi:hypothetical protein
MGAGEHTYEVFHDWGELPAGLRYGSTHGVCQDMQGRIYIAHTVHASSQVEHTVAAFDEKGKFIRSWGSEFRHTWMVKMTLTGEEVFRIGYPKESPYYNLDAEGKTGGEVQSDQCRDRSQWRYLPSGRLRLVLHQPIQFEGRVDPQLWLRGERTRAAIEPVRLDRHNNRLRTLSLDGKHVAFSGGVNLPCHLHERRGVMVVPDLGARVTLIDRDNRVITHLGEDASGTWQQLCTQAATYLLSSGSRSAGSPSSKIA